MTTPNPMSVVEALEFLNSLARDCHAQNKLVRPAFILDKTQKALPLARSMVEKLEHYDELVEALEWVVRQIVEGNMPNSGFQKDWLLEKDDCPAVIKKMLGGKT